MLLSFLSLLGLRFSMGRLNAGDPRFVLAMESEHVRFTFPGSSSFSGVIHGKRALRAWLERFCALGLQIFADEVVAIGFPWKMTVCVRGTDYMDAPDGTRVYENRYVMWAHMRWFKLVDYEVYEDTHAPERADAWLAEHRPDLARPAVVS